MTTSTAVLSGILPSPIATYSSLDSLQWRGGWRPECILKRFITVWQSAAGRTMLEQNYQPKNRPDKSQLWKRFFLAPTTKMQTLYRQIMNSMGQSGHNAVSENTRVCVCFSLPHSKPCVCERVECDKSKLGPLTLWENFYLRLLRFSDPKMPSNYPGCILSDGHSTATAAKGVELLDCGDK